MSNRRIAKWDNVKLLMILCVVIGHTIYEFLGDDTGIAKGIYLFIYTFHIPVFIYLAGLFSKRTVVLKRYDRVIEYLFIYVFMKFLDYLGRCLTCSVRRGDLFSVEFLKEIWEGLHTGRKGFHLFWEEGPGWFALALAVFLLVTMLIKDIHWKTVLIATVALGCLAGLDNHLGNHLASMRLCTFYPVFLMGYYTPVSWFTRKKDGSVWQEVALSPLLSGVIVVSVLLFCLYTGNRLYPKINFLKGKCDYMKLGMGVNGVAWRLLCYLFWILMIIAVINICPRGKTFLSWLGTRTMSIFIWHKFVLTIILKLFFGKYYMRHYMPHYYMIGAFCLAVMITVVTAYLPDCRISKWNRIKIGGTEG